MSLPLPASNIQQQRSMAQQRQELVERMRFSDGIESLVDKAPAEIARPLDAVPQVFAKRIEDLTPTGTDSEPVYDMETLERFWAQVFGSSQITLADFEWYRIVVAWRITRTLAVIFRVCQTDELIGESIARRGETDRCIWNEYPGYPTKKAAAQGWLEQIPWEGEKHDLGLAIPDVPDGAIDERGLIRSEYLPTADVRLLAWLDVIGAVADRLGIEAGSVEFPNLGTYGLYGVLEPKLCRLLWPSRFDVLHFEVKMVHDVLEMLQLSGGQRTARKKLKERYGFTNDECAALISAAGREASNQVGTESTEQARALLVLRLEEIIDRAKGAMDLKVELQALRSLAQVQGITRVEPEDEKKAFGKAIRSVAEARKKNTPVFDIAASTSQGGE